MKEKGKIKLVGFLVIIIFIISLHFVNSSISPKPLLNLIKERSNNNNKDDGIRGKYWVVMTSINPPTETVKKLSLLKDWKTVVVADKKTPKNWTQENVVLLDIETQKQKLGYSIIDHLPFNHYSRKNIGYLFAIQHGAEVIYEVDDDNIPLFSEDIPFIKEYAKEDMLIYDKKDLKHMVNPYAYFGHGDIWPRGYPLEFRSWSHLYSSDIFTRSTVVPSVQQSLANGDPDVDAIYRLSHKKNGIPIDIEWEEKETVAIPPGTMVPYNTQTTIQRKEAFWGLLLPISVSFRVCDIWRGYWQQRMLWEMGSVLSFSSPIVYQERNEHDLYKDYEEEEDLYKKSGKLVRFLLNKWTPPPKSSRFEEVLLDLSYEMYVHGFWGYEDVILTAAWIEDLHNIVGYEFPELSLLFSKREKVTVDNNDNNNKKKKVKTAASSTSKKKEISVEGVVSFAPLSVRPPRESYKTLLLYWPEKWGIRFHLDKPEHELEACLNATEIAPIISIENVFKHKIHPTTVSTHNPFFINKYKKNKKTKITDYGRNHWKFFLDKYSEADVIAFIDDDACLLRPILPSEVIDEKGRLVTRSITTGFVSYRRYIEETLGWKYLGNFMTDFPVFIWRDMLKDIRRDLTQIITPNASFSSHDYYSSFPDVFQQMLSLSKERISKLSEYNILLNYAYNSPKWRGRYQWQTFPSGGNVTVFGMSTHQHGSLSETGRCWSNRNMHVPNFMWIYPNNLMYAYDHYTNSFKSRPWGRGVVINASHEKWLSSKKVKMDVMKQRELVEWKKLKARVDSHPNIIKQWAKCFFFPK